MQLSVDHILPKKAGGSDAPENKITCCRSCNSVTSHMKFAPGVTVSEVIAQKCDRVQKRNRECLDFWKAEVVQSYLTTCDLLVQPSRPTDSSISQT